MGPYPSMSTETASILRALAEHTQQQRQSWSFWYQTMYFNPMWSGRSMVLVPNVGNKLGFASNYVIIIGPSKSYVII